MTQTTAPADASSNTAQPRVRRRARRRDVAANKIAGVTLRGLPYIPDRVKSLLLGGRSITLDGNTLDPTLQLMLAGQQALGLDGLVADDDYVAARHQLELLAGSFTQKIPVSAVADLMVTGAVGPIRARHYRTGEPDAPLLVFYHGGGHVIGSIDTHDDLCREICRTGRVHVLSVDYRLAPENPAPAGAEDAYAAYRWACKHAAELGADPQRVAVGGDSAGGNLAALVSLRARDEKAPLPALQLLLYPVTDYHGQTRSQTLFARGFFLTRRDMDWFSARFLVGVRGDRPACHRCCATTCPGCRPRWSSPPGSTRCATKAGTTPRPCGTRAWPSTTGSTDRSCTASPTSPRWVVPAPPRPPTSSRPCAHI